MNNEIISFLSDFFAGFLVNAINLLLGLMVVFMVKEAILNYVGGNKLVKEAKEEKIYVSDFVWVVILAFVTMGYLYRKTVDLGWIGLVISVLSGLVIGLV